MRDPLGIDVVALVAGIDVAPSEQAPTKGRRPVVPIDPETICRGPKARVLDQVGAFEHEIAQGCFSTCSRPPDRSRHCTQGCPLGRGDGRTIHDPVLHPLGATLGSLSARAENACSRRPGVFRHTLNVDPAFVPEAATHRQVRARFERLRPEAGQQGEGRDHAGLLLGGKAGELVQVAQVTGSPAARRVQ